MDFKELQNETSELLNFTDGVTDQNYTSAQVKAAINRAYKREVRLAKKEGISDWFKVVQTVTWPASQLQLKLTDDLTNKSLLRVYDRTDNDPGLPLDLATTGNLGRIFWKNRNTLQWGSASGPAQAKTLDFVYMADAVNMTEDGEEPFLIPSEDRELLYWSAAIELRLRSDEDIPQMWAARHRDVQMDYWKKVAQGKPSDSPPTIRIVRAQDNTFVYYN